MAKDWDRENMKTLGVNLKKNEAEAFKAYAAAHDTTVGALLRGFIQSVLAEENRPNQPDRLTGIPHIVSYKNTDRLKHETAFHNPNDLNPDGILNEILDTYFRFVTKVRK